MKTKSRKSQKRNQKPVSGMRHIGSLVEHMNGKIELIAEQHTSVVDKLDHHTNILNAHTAILDAHTAKLDAHTEMIGSLKMDVEIIKTDVEFIKGSLKKKIDVEEFSALERRVAVLEKRR